MKKNNGYKSGKIFWGIFVIITIMAFQTAGFAQSGKRINSDSLFAVARKTAQTGDRQLAIQYCRQILQQSPNYHDVRVYMGRVMAWEKKYAESRRELLTVLKIKRTHKAALDALLDVQFWSGETQSGLNIAIQALRSYPNNLNFLFKKARLLLKLDRKKEAVQPLERLLELDPAHPQGLKLAKRLKSDIQLHKAGLKYSYDKFDRDGSSYGPWQMASFDISRRTGIGTVILRVNYANRKLGSTPKKGFQYEVDAYPKLMPGLYTYLNAGYSGDKVFPEWRFGLEPFKSLGKGFEFSAGLRHLRFSSSEVTIYTGSLGKYYKNYWFSFRPYISPKDVGTSFSGHFFIRRYFSNAENYITLSFGSGSSPVEVSYREELQRLDSRKAGFELQRMLTRSIIFKMSTGYEYEEYRVDTFGKRWAFSIDLKKRF